MFKCIFVLYILFVLVLVCQDRVPAEDKEVFNKIGLEVYYADLEKNTTVSGIVRTHDVFKHTAFGYGIQYIRGWTPNVSQVYGWTTVIFEGKGYLDGTGLTATLGDMEAWAMYTGIRFNVNPEDPFVGYIGLDVGVANLNDIKYTLQSAGAPSMEAKGLKGGFGLYYAIGLGVKTDLNDAWTMDLGYKLRDFGTLDGINSLILVKDQDIKVSSIDLSLRFRF